MLRDVSSSNVDSSREMMQCESLIDWADVCHSVSRIDNDAGLHSLSVECEDSLKNDENDVINDLCITCTATYNELNPYCSNITWKSRSLLASGFNGGSVRSSLQS